MQPQLNDPTPVNGVTPVRIEDEMRTSYLTYAMSVIVSRALPDARDGLKPVQRRILYAMHEMGIRPTTSHRKCARIAGEVLGKYHPHGETSVYDSLVRMAQTFSLRYPLVDGQGNFGSVDGDPPAAMRYTEARLAGIAEEMLADIEQDTVNYTANFDESTEEPEVLPSQLPNLLINGSAGIAVGMATNIPPYNLSEICDAICHVIDYPDCGTTDLSRIVPGPDFPTGAIIRGKQGIMSTLTDGRGKIMMEAVAEIEDNRGRQNIVVTELPYQVNKANLVQRIADMVREKKMDGISGIRDESDRHGMRVVVEIRRDAQANVVLNHLFRRTPLRSAFNSIVLALVDGQPQILPMKRALVLFIEQREIVIRRRSEYRLQRAVDRDHIVQGLLLAMGRMDEVIDTVRASPDVETARIQLMANLSLSQPQAQAILDMQLRRLAVLERERLENEHRELAATIAGLQGLLADPAKVLTLVKEETAAIKAKFGDARRTRIFDEEIGEQADEDFVTHQDVVVTLSEKGYVKRFPRDTFRTQNRGGKGVRGMRVREDDGLLQLVIADTHDTLLLCTNRGRVYPLRVFQIPADQSRNNRGVLLVNLVQLRPGELVQAVLRTGPKLDADRVVLATRLGEVKCLKAGELVKLRPRGMPIMKLKDDDELVSVRPAEGAKDVVLVSAKGQSIRFGTDILSSKSRSAGGVPGIKLQPGDEVVGMDVVNPSDRLLVVSKRGFGKASDLSAYPTQGRNGQGVRTMRVTEKTGPVASIARVVPDTGDDELFIISAKAQVVRIGLDGVRRAGRATSGVTLWRDRQPDDSVVSVSLCPKDLVGDDE